LTFIQKPVILYYTKDEVDMTKCIQCGKELDAKLDEECYTNLGGGPYCESHWMKWEETDARLAAEWAEYRNESEQGR
jgi:hypothetical protein